MTEYSENHETPSEEKSKAELFQENPERFEDLQSCLLVVRRDPVTKKLMILNQCQNIEESFVVEGYVEDAMAAFRHAYRVKQAQTQTKIVKPNGHFLNGLRRK